MFRNWKARTSSDIVVYCEAALTEGNMPVTGHLTALNGGISIKSQLPIQTTDTGLPQNLFTR
jgi:hypothetical protein